MRKNDGKLLSVGIDVGTTTFQIVLSEITVANQSRIGYMPRLDIEQRRVIYESTPELTPLVKPDEVDVNKLRTLIQREYTAAGIKPSDVDTGAVIITGESARTKNAEAILAGLSTLAGDFVVSVAGPNVESQISARGSGAAAWSAQKYTSAINIDIGGGSANAALFVSGKNISSSAAMVGGRQAILEENTGKLIHLAPSGKLIAEKFGIQELQIGKRPSLSALRKLTDVMAEVIVDLALGIDSVMFDATKLAAPMLVANPAAAYFISGGVGKLYYDEDPVNTLEEVIKFGDVGPLLARSLHENERWQKLPVLKPRQTIRATVLGAASQQVSMSGSTIWVAEKLLPLRNMPVIEPVLPDLKDPLEIKKAFLKALERWDSGSDAKAGYVINLVLPKKLKFNQLKILCQGILEFASTEIVPGYPLSLVTERDYAQIIGQTIQIAAPKCPLIVVDQIQLGEGDYIDIGEPLFNGRIVPVSVKTLIFYQ